MTAFTTTELLTIIHGMTHTIEDFMPMSDHQTNVKDKLTKQHKDVRRMLYANLTEELKAVRPNSYMVYRMELASRVPDRYDPDPLTEAQYNKLKGMWDDNGLTDGKPFDPHSFRPSFDLPTGWVMGEIGSMTIGCSPEGETSS